MSTNNNEHQQLFFANVEVGEYSALTQFDFNHDKKSKLTPQQVCHAVITQQHVLASPSGYEDDRIHIISKLTQSEDIKKYAQQSQLKLQKQSTVDPCVIESSILSYIRVKLQVCGWNRLNGLLIKGDLFAKSPTTLIACNASMNVQEGRLTVSLAHPHSCKYSPLDVSGITVPVPPVPCIVLPTMSSGFVAKVFKSPPLVNSLFKTEQDFKSYWLTSHGLLLPTIEAYVQVRLNDMELTYPSCCLWSSKLNEVRSQSVDTSQITKQLIDDLEAIWIFSNPLLQFIEKAKPVAPKVAWVKSSEMLKSAHTTSISDLPTVEQIIPRVVPPRPQLPPAPTLSTTVSETSRGEKEHPVATNPKPVQKSIPKVNPLNDSSPKDVGKKKTLGPKRRKMPTDTTTNTSKSNAAKKTTKESSKAKVSENESEDNHQTESAKEGEKQGETHDDESAAAISDALAFDDVLEEKNIPNTNHESRVKETTTSKTPQTGKKHAREEENQSKSKRSKPEVDVSSLDFSIENLNARTVNELQAFCRKEQLKISGTKPDLVARLKEFIEKKDAPK